MNEKQTRKLIEIARQKNLFLMEAIWSRCFPVYKELRRIIESGEIGEVMEVAVQLGFPMSNVERIRSKELGGGVILDLGVYALQFQQFVFRGLKPNKVVATGHLNEEGIDLSASAIITYPGSKTAVVSISSLVQLSSEGIVYGTKGTIKVNEINSAGLAYQADEARKCIREGKIECEHITHEETIQLAQLMDKLRQELGVVFPVDSESY
ncbi:hypothetical protein NQ317_016073 [Molorchus minor]|uniref:GFO/IDH/MocA-like oxidoreductase domain-containing protein n=1 Tax=Molorchus minor TaxID=1323400 RepID=A0ABQ9IY75_9CUCU|nr:hypothetical protein NQ317_016073 [Molorchus minor]